MGPQSCDCGNYRCDSHSASVNSFNGAAVFRLRKPNLHGPSDPYPIASMGPQSFDCGNGIRQNRCVVRRSPGFNGAAVFRLRKLHGMAHDRIRCDALQWGRSLSTAETAHLDGVAVQTSACFNGAAVFRLRKLQMASTRCTVWIASFNGAAVLRLRKPATNGCTVPRESASMGPQSCDCGNPVARDIGLNPAALQWGRSLATAETMRPREPLRPLSFNGAAVLRLRKLPTLRPAKTRAGACFNGAAVFRLRKRPSRVLDRYSTVTASMGPQSCDCGNRGRCNRQRVLRQASMGPQSFDCGNWLSWRWLSLSRPMLQWGRSLSTAETAWLQQIVRSAAVCFNGAAVLRLRKRCALRRVVGDASGASMGPQSFDCGNVQSAI